MADCFTPESTAPQIITVNRTNHQLTMLRHHPPPPMSSSSSSDSEEEDMANCLIMLAHSVVSPVKEENTSDDHIYCQKTNKKLKTRSVTEMATTTTTAGEISGFQSYDCKTCNRVFPSFQALGGHRASHKKPKLPTVFDDRTSSVPVSVTTEYRQPELTDVYKENKVIVAKSPSPAIHGCIPTGHKVSSSKTKVHECSICGSEFLSGQALGGHMRRHRTPPPPSTEAKHSSEKSPVLSLDLNLPPPEVVDVDGHSNFQFKLNSSQQPLVFSAAALVDCYY